MRICLVSDNLVDYHNTWSGAELVVQYLTSLLQRENQVVSILTIRSKKKEAPEGVFPVPALNSRFWFFKKVIPFHILIRAIAIFFYLKKIKPDIIHFFHSNSLFLPVMLNTLILRIPTTFTVLDYNIICPTGHLRLKDGKICQARAGWICKKCIPLPKLLERRLERWLAGKLKQLITFTETSKKRLVWHGFLQEKIKVKYIYKFSFDAPQGNENSIFKPNDFLFVGTFLKQKGLHIAIQAMPYVREQVPDARLIVIGRGGGEDKQRIEELINQLNLADAVQFLGQKKNEETLKIIFQSNLVVVAEQWFSDFGPVALLEAMALGKPVVAGRIGSSSDFIKDSYNGFLVEYDKPEKFAEKIVWLLQNKERARELGKKARETIQTIFAGEQKKEILELYTLL